MGPRPSSSVPETDRPASDPLSGSQLFTPEEVREFQRLAKEHANADLTEAEAQDLASRLLRILATVRDVQQKVTAPPKPRLDLREVTLQLRRLQHELELSAQRPSNWRWAIIALHDVLRIVLGFYVSEALSPRPAFDRLTAERPELPQVRTSLDLLEELRIKCTTVGVLRWSVTRDRLCTMVSDCLRVVQRLEPETSGAISTIEDVLRELS